MRFQMLIPMLLPLLLLGGQAAPLSDLVWLTTGDRVSGEIVKLEGEKLSVKTAFAGEIAIDWSMVERIETEREFDVELESGMRLGGRIERTAGEVRITSSDIDEVVTSEELSRIERPAAQETFWNRADLDISLGTNITGGNSVLRQNSISANFSHRKPRRRFIAEVRSILSKEEKSERISRNEAELRIDRYLKPRFFLYGTGGFESDEKSLLDFRLTAGGGAGWQIKKNARDDFSLRGGFNVIRERFGPSDSEPGSLSTSTETLVGFDAERKTKRNIVMSLQLALRPSLEQDRYRFTGDAGVRVPFFGFMNWSLSGFTRFDSHPPTDKKRNDYGVISAFGLSW